MVNDFAIFELLLEEVRNKFNKPLKVNSDFQTLSKTIAKDTGSIISTSTLKRYWKQKDYNKELSCKIHTSILNIMAEYIGYRNYAAFEKKEINTPTKTSHMTATTRVKSVQLQPGQQLCLTWAPNRKVIIRHDKDNQFTVVSSLNSKLQPGDCFEVNDIVNRCPLLLFNLRQTNNPPTDYICAQDYSLHVELLEN